MSETYIHPTREQVAALAALEVDGPIVMINLLKFRADGGREAYAEYGEAAGPFLAKSGASLRYIGDCLTTMIGGEDWDEAILVEYPSKQAFLDMTGDPDYPSEIRAGALADSRLIFTVQRSG